MNEALVRDFINAVKAENKKTSAYDTPATVTRVDGGTAWVHIPGGVDETPIKMTVNAKEGDTVQVRVADGRAWIVGNETAPPTDDAKANEADTKATSARVIAVGAQDTADEANYTAVVAKDTAESILVYDHSYVLQTIDGELCAVFTAAVYQGGKDIITRFPEDMFAWYIKSEDSITGTTDKQFLNNGYQTTVRLSDCKYGSEVISIFSINDDSEALTADDSNLTTNDSESITVRATGESVKVRELTTATNIYDAEKLLIVGTQDEHLVSMSTLQDYLNRNLDKQVLFNTTAVWNAQSTLQSAANTLYVYTDHYIDDDNNVIAGIKVGDGNAYLIDLPFTDSVSLDHISDSSIHISSEERVFWNNKVSVYYGSNETAIFTTASIL